MKQREAVVQVLERHWWYARLSTLRDELIWNPIFVTNAKEPFANIRRIVQRTPKEIYIIRPWLYWLVKERKRLEQLWLEQITQKNKDDPAIQKQSHSYYQWLLVDIWNLKHFLTYIPHQDQNKVCFSDKWMHLKDIITENNLEWPIKMIKRTETIDVIRLNNDNKLPSNVFEVEHSTNIINSLNKFAELKGLSAWCYIVADESRHKEFDKNASLTVYKDINPKFLSYENLENYYDKITEYYSLKKLTWF